MSTDTFGERDVTITLLGKEWFSLVAVMSKKPLSTKGREIYRVAAKKIADQLTAAAEDPLASLVDRVHVNDPTAIERYKGFVIRKPADAAGFMWERSKDVFLSIETARIDIDLFVAKVDVAR